MIINNLKLIQLIDTFIFLISFSIIYFFNLSPIKPVVIAIICSISLKIYLFQSLSKSIQVSNLIIFGINTRRNRIERLIKLATASIVLLVCSYFLKNYSTEMFWWVIASISLTSLFESFFRLSRWTILIDGSCLYVNKLFSKPIGLNQNTKVSIITNLKIELIDNEKATELIFDSEEVSKLQNYISKIL
jgi:hypothetical protein